MPIEFRKIIRMMKLSNHLFSIMFTISRLKEPVWWNKYSERASLTTILVPMAHPYSSSKVVSSVVSVYPRELGLLKFFFYM